VVQNGAVASDVPAARQVLGILRYLARQPRPVPASAIARDLGLPRSTTYHLLRELTDAGFVVHLADDRRYGLGVSAYEIGTGYVRQEPLQRLARVPLSSLAAATGHVSHLAVMHGREVLYVIEERPPGRAPLVTDVGVRLPAPLTASGRAMLALLPAAAVRALFPEPSAFVLRYSAGPRSPRELRELLAGARRAGYATEHGEVTPGFSSVAAAVRDHGGHPVASVALTFPDAETDGASAAGAGGAAGGVPVAGVAGGAAAAAGVPVAGGASAERFAPLVRQAAAEIARRIGGSAG
jgi:DNA-binding IclR family transcriptional regulator